MRNEDTQDHPVSIKRRVSPETPYCCPKYYIPNEFGPMVVWSPCAPGCSAPFGRSWSLRSSLPRDAVGRCCARRRAAPSLPSARPRIERTNEQGTRLWRHRLASSLRSSLSGRTPGFHSCALRRRTAFVSSFLLVRRSCRALAVHVCAQRDARRASPRGESADPPGGGETAPDDVGVLLSGGPDVPGRVTVPSAGQSCRRRWLTRRAGGRSIFTPLIRGD